MVVQYHPLTEVYIVALDSQLPWWYLVYRCKWWYKNIKENLQKCFVTIFLHVNVGELYHGMPEK